MIGDEHMTPQLPVYVEQALGTLTGAGFKAYLVGGCVRDLLSGITPHDYDIASNAPAEAIEKLFDRVLPTGIKHGTVTALVPDNQTNKTMPLEITRMRSDGDYTDRRRPDSVVFVDDIHADLSRRDFTINAMAIDAEDLSHIIDPFNGAHDLKARKITAVGSASKRFEEDALRILRAFRFACVLGFDITPDTLKPALDCAPLLKAVSAERVFTELMKSLLSKHPNRLDPLLLHGGLAPFELHHTLHPAEALCRVPAVRSIRLTALCQLARSDASMVCTALKTDRSLMREAVLLQTLLQADEPVDLAGLKALLRPLPIDLWLPYLDIRREISGEHNHLLYHNMRQAVWQNHPLLISDLALNGDDLMELGYAGREIGAVFQKLMVYIDLFPEHNSKEQLLAFLRKTL